LPQTGSFVGNATTKPVEGVAKERVVENVDV
jgi:hypothetical protein